MREAQQDEAGKRRAEGATLAELARSYGVGREHDFETVRAKTGSPHDADMVKQCLGTIRPVRRSLRPSASHLPSYIRC